MAKRSKASKRSRKGKSKLGLLISIALLILIGLYFAALEYTKPHVTGDALRFDSFVALAEEGRIREARLLDEDAYVVGTYVKGDSDGQPSADSLADGAAALDDHAGHGGAGGEIGTAGEAQPEPEGAVRAYNAPLVRGYQTTLIKLLIENRIPIFVDQQVGKRVAGVAIYTIPGLILILLFVYVIVSYIKGTGLFGVKSGARKITAEESKLTFADVAGQDAAIRELRDIKDFLADPQKYVALGATIPKGILLYGPPGSGKTLISRALAGEANASFYSISGSDFVELYVGVGAARVRDLFEEARANAPAIVFIDELDSVGRRRTGGTGGASQGGTHGEQEQALNQILTEMDGFSPMEGIVVMGATNRPDVLDPALLRPGRFDRAVGLERADEAGRTAILEVHATSKKLADDVDVRELARRAIGLSGADLASLMNEGALLAARSGKQSVSMADLEEALERIKDAPERQRRLSMRDRSFGRSSTEVRVTFGDVAGVDEAITELAEVKEYLSEPERFVEMGARPPRGFLLVGPPGVGKTLLARAVAGEANAVFFSVAATEFVEVFVGEGAARVRDLFAEARAMAPAIVFIDEIDAIGAHRLAASSGNRESEQTLNQILIELDGFQARSGVIVMAASNRPDILDPALVRPGRFDRTVAIGLPDRKGRKAILEVHSRGKRLAADVDLDLVAGLTRGLSGAELANVMNEATLLAARRNKPAADMRLIEEAIERVGLGVSRSHILSDSERAVVAYHEVGHALVGRALSGAVTPHRLTIIPRGKALGVTWNQDAVERLVHGKAVLIEQMAGILGGRAAEELIFGEPSSGAADDLARVRRIARQMVCELGMSEALGHMSYTDPQDPDGSPLSDEAARMIDVEIRKLVDAAYAQATAVLSASKVQLDRVAKALIEKETLSGAELEELAGPPVAVRPAAGNGATRPGKERPRAGADLSARYRI